LQDAIEANEQEHLQDAIKANEQEVTLSKVINKFQKWAPAATVITASISNTPPVHIRAQGVANLRTSASTISSLSSLSQSTNSRTHSIARTRGQKEASQDVEESDSENKDDFGLVEEPEDNLPADRSGPTWEEENDEVSDVTVPNEDGEMDEELDSINSLVRQLKWKFKWINKEDPPAVLDKAMCCFYDGP
jgi:hypothetical protein